MHEAILAHQDLKAITPELRLYTQQQIKEARMLGFYAGIAIAVVIGICAKSCAG